MTLKISEPPPSTYSKLVTAKIARVIDNPGAESFVNDLADVLESLGMDTKLHAVRTAMFYGLCRPLTTTKLLKVPAAVRGYAIVGSLDPDYHFLTVTSLYRQNILSRAAVTQAVESWIIGDPADVAARYLSATGPGVFNPFVPVQWIKELIESAAWGNPPKAAAWLAQSDLKNLHWAMRIISRCSRGETALGDPSAAAVDLMESYRYDVPLPFIGEVFKSDTVGCPASAVVRMYRKGWVNAGFTAEIIGGAVSGDPAAAVLDSHDMRGNKNLVKLVVEKDVGPSSPLLAAMQVAADPEWVIKMIGKTKHPVSDSVRKSITA